MEWNDSLNKIGLLLCHSHIELRLRFIWTWDWSEIEMRLSGSLVEIELRLSWSWDKLTLNKGKNWAFIGVELWFKICFRSTYVAEQLLFSMLFLFLSNQRAIFLAFWGVYSYSAIIFIFFVSFNSGIWFWLNFGLFWTFLVPNGLFLGRVEFKNCFCVYPYSWTTLFSIIPSAFLLFGP